MFVIADRLQYHLGMALVAPEKLLYNNSFRKCEFTAATQYLWAPDSHSYPAQCDDPISFP